MRGPKLLNFAVILRSSVELVNWAASTTPGHEVPAAAARPEWASSVPRAADAPTAGTATSPGRHATSATTLRPATLVRARPSPACIPTLLVSSLGDRREEPLALGVGDLLARQPVASRREPSNELEGRPTAESDAWSRR